MTRISLLDAMRVKPKDRSQMARSIGGNTGERSSRGYILQDQYGLNGRRFSLQHVLGANNSISLAVAVFACLTMPASLRATDAADPHAPFNLGDRFPSATECAECHPLHYKQWSISQHAYSQMSPVFNAMQGTVGVLSNGTLGDFCIRCHTPVGMNLKEAEFGSNIDRHPTSREGVTCVVCHRLTKPYGKITGRLPLAQGPITDPIYGPVGDSTELNKVIEKRGLITEADSTKVGRKVHREIAPLKFLHASGMCGQCHDVTESNGFRLEEAFSEWKNSPANKKGISCQDCHMGKEPGRVLAERSDPDFDKKNYAYGPAAIVGNIETAPRKLTNHKFVGPDYSVLPPALFPIHTSTKEESQKDDPTIPGWTIRQWLEFDWNAGWGTDEFEDKVTDDYKFPDIWASVDDRYDAREVVEGNIALLKEIEADRLKLLQNGYKLEDIVVDRADDRGIKFRVKVASGTDGHNVPTGFDGERVVWLYVRVLDAKGEVVHVSGDLDPNGDVRDLHSAYVHNREMPLDKELLSLQSKFLTFATRGAEREQVIAVPYSLTPTPFLQPETRSAVIVGRHFGARKHRRGISPGSHRWGTYYVKKGELTGHGPYKAVVQLKAAMVPVNLLNAIKGVGFDYGLSARDVAEALVAGHQVIWEKDVTFDVHDGKKMASERAGIDNPSDAVRR